MAGLSPARLAVLERLAGQIIGTGAVRVGVDGVDGAGKTIFADQLADVLDGSGHEITRVSVDGFHHPQHVRYRRGRSSPEGFWLDSYDYATFRTDVLDPFCPGGHRRYRRALRDVATDDQLDVPYEQAAVGAILIVDGIFLHRDELLTSWDFSVYLQVPFDVTFARMATRDGCPANPAALENRRYVVGQQLYLAACEPSARATVVVDNAEPDAPHVM